MDSFQIIITPTAQKDLIEIRDYIAYVLGVPLVALKYIRDIREQIEKLAYLASSISPVPFEPWHSKEIRKVIANNFYIYYWINTTTNTVYVISVIYAKRDQLKALRNVHLEN